MKKSLQELMTSLQLFNNALQVDEIFLVHCINSVHTSIILTLGLLTNTPSIP